MQFKYFHRDTLMSSNDKVMHNNKELSNMINNRKQVYINREGFFNKYPCSFCYFIFGLFSYTLAFIASEKEKSYVILFSFTVGIFSVVGLLIFFAEYMWYRIDMGKTVTEKEFGGVKITESVKHGKNSVVILLLFNLGFWTYVSTGAITVYRIKALLILVIIWIIVGLFTFFVYRKFLKGTSELRKFLINEKFIQIIVPPKPIFHVNWMQIDRIEVNLQPYLKYPDIHSKYSTIHTRKYIFINELKFIGKNYNQTFQILGGRDFNIKLNEIFDLLEKFAIKLNKEFIRFEKK